MSCVTDCCSTISVAIPGPAGATGANGTNGTNGINAFTTASTFMMPAELANVTVTVVANTMLAPGEIVQLNGGSATGFFQVQSRIGSTQVVLKNLKSTGAGAYLTNSAPGTVFPNATAVNPGGPQGPTGATPAGPYFAIANNLNEGNASLMRLNLALGTIATKNVGVANTQFAPNDGNIVDQYPVFGTTTGFATRDPATARGLLALTKGVANGNIPPVDDAAFTNLEPVFATAAGIESVTPAIARTRLGVSGSDYLLYRYQSASGDGGNFNTGGPNTVPLNTEVADTGSHGSLSANTILLDAGTYRFQFGVTGYQVDWFQGYLYNSDDGVVINNTDGSGTYGQVVKSAAGAGIPKIATGQGRFTLAANKHIQLRAGCTATQAGSGFGKDGAVSANVDTAGSSYLVVYGWILLIKE